jgi:CBS domain containing-hemolysin-like protein
MVPRIAMSRCRDATIDEAIDTIVDEGHSRIPSTRTRRRDHRDPLREGPAAVPEVGAPTAAAPIAAPDPGLVPESMSVDDLLHEFQRRKVHIAIVLDEYGGTAGLVTIEDLLEEIVGEIQDEYDVEEPMIERSRTTRRGSTAGRRRRPRGPVRHDVPLEDEDEYDTVGGLDLPPDRRRAEAGRPGVARRPDADRRDDRRPARVEGARRPEPRGDGSVGRRGGPLGSDRDAPAAAA